MIKLNIAEFLEKKGKTRYWLAKQMDISYENLTKMVNNQSKMIMFKNIEALCRILECTPNELFIITDD